MRRCCWRLTRPSMSTNRLAVGSALRATSLMSEAVRLGRETVRGADPTGSLSRRQMLQRTAAGFGMLGLTSLLLGGRATSAFASAARPPLFAPRAKRVIFLFMNGGPSHVDTFDPKPALERYAGQQPTGNLFKASKGTGFMPSPLKFSKCGRSGIDVSETLPHIAQVIDDC